MKHFTKILLFLLILLSACNLFRGKTAEQLFDPKPISLPQGGQQVINGINTLGLDLIKDISDSLPQTNQMLSPFSLASVLTMLQQGASGQTLSELNNLLNLGGLTKQQIADVFKTIMEKLPEIDRKVQIFPANSLWIKNTITVEENYKDLIKKYFLADIFTAPFDNNTVNQMNSWVSDKTNGKIDKITDNLDNYVMVLLNAVYFYGQWLDNFNEQNTQNQTFHLDSSHTVSVPMMNDKIDYTGFAAFDSVIVGEIFYGRGNFSMVIIVPQNTYDLNYFIQKLNMQTINSWIKDLYYTKAQVVLPKFTFKSEFQNLADLLHKHGLITALSPQADFSEINPSVYLSQVVQKTYIDVNEKGTEAATVTGGFMEMTSTMPQFLIADRPFLFLIRETSTDLILFMGVVNNPAE